MSEAILTASERTDRGSGPASRLRRDGLVPAVVYGLGEDNVTVAVGERELTNILQGVAGANTVITLKVGSDEHLTLARQIQRHPVRGTLVHVDFIRVDPDAKVSAEVPVHLVGEPDGVKSGGVLEQLIFMLTIEAKPSEIPNTLEADVSALEIGDQIRVSELALPSGVTTTHEDEELLAQVIAPRVEEEPVTVEGEELEGEEAAEGEGAPAAEAGDGDDGDAGGAESDGD